MGIITSIYKKSAVHRYDDNGYIKYFSAADFPGLNAEPFSFLSGKNTLRGYFYSYAGCREDVLIIFCHGIGGGHRSYMTEIDLLCRKGYRVLAYDNTGCFESDGKDIICMSESLADLDAAVTHLKNEGIFNNYKAVYVIGHSWGGFAAANIASFHPEIKKVVVIAGFISATALLLGWLGDEKKAVNKYILKKILAYEKSAAPKYWDAFTLNSVKNKGTKFLFAHSVDDTTVSYRLNTKRIQDEADADNVSFIICRGKLHNPNYTSDAVSYMARVFGDFNRANKAGKLKTPEKKKEFFKDTDWVRMTRQDEDFWKQVLTFIEE